MLAPAMSQKALLKTLLVVVLLGAGGAFLYLNSAKAPVKEAAETHALLQKLPPKTLAFYSWRSDDKEYRNLQVKSALHSSNAYLSEFGSLPIEASQQRLLETILKAIATSGLISEDPATPDGMSEFLAFLQSNSPMPDAGMYITARDTVDLKALAAKLKTALEEEKVTVTETPQGDKLLLTVTEDVVTIYALFDSHQAAITTSNALTQNLFTTEPVGGFQEIKGSQSYQQIMALHNGNGAQFGLGLADYAAISKLASGAVPQEAAAGLDEAPIGLVSLGQYASDAFTTEILAQLAPKNDQQKLLINNISKPASNTLLDRLPEASAFFLILDGQLLRTVQEGAVSDLSPEEKAAAQPYIETLMKVKGISIGALPAGRDALVPDIFITIQNDEPGKLMDFVTEQTRDLISTQIPMANWLEKDVDGVKVKYILTPLGIGLYLASIKDSFVATSTDSAMAEMIKAIKSGSSAAKHFPATISAIAPNTPLVSGYLDFKKIADAVESVQGSMSMFTGGASALNAEEIQNLKRMGSATFGLSVTNELLRLRWDLKPSK